MIDPMPQLTPIQNPFRIHASQDSSRSRHPQTDTKDGAAALAVERARSIDGSRTMAGMLLAAVLAAMLVVADQLIETWADGHLLVVWVALWAVTFATLSYLITPLRLWTARLTHRWERWSTQRAQIRMEHELWDLARQDYRVMDELSAARLRSQRE